MKTLILASCLVFLSLASPSSFLRSWVNTKLDSIPPIANQLFPQMMESLNYPYQQHNITTQDGYINCYFRIQAKNTEIQSGLPVVYLQHGLLDSGDDWVINDEPLAPGLILANAGYDVWIGNTRGNRYSQGHVQWNSSNPNSEYWQFSWQEMSLYDLPAAFQYINQETGQKIHYLGHSQGTVIMFAALARHDPVVIPLLEVFCAAGPVAYVNHATSPMVDLLGKDNIGGILYHLLDGDKFLFLTPEQYKVSELTCEVDTPTCELFVKETADVHPDVDNMARMDVFTGHFPAGTSYQNMDYWNQMFLNNEFQMYNYEEAGNLEHYNQTTPPLIDLAQINVPVHLFAGIWDELADPTDVARLNASLTNSPWVTYYTYDYGHATFVWGKNTSYVYDVMSFFKNSTNIEDNYENTMNFTDAFQLYD